MGSRDSWEQVAGCEEQWLRVQGYASERDEVKPNQIGAAQVQFQKFRSIPTRYSMQKNTNPIRKLCEECIAYFSMEGSTYGNGLYLMSMVCQRHLHFSAPCYSLQHNSSTWFGLIAALDTKASCLAEIQKDEQRGAQNFKKAAVG